MTKHKPRRIPIQLAASASVERLQNLVVPPPVPRRRAAPERYVVRNAATLPLAGVVGWVVDMMKDN
jgi:hypothetical protein